MLLCWCFDGVGRLLERGVVDVGVDVLMGFER